MYIILLINQTDKPLRNKNTNEIINGAKLNIYGSYGCFQTPINNNAYMVSDEECIYISGKHVIKMDIKYKKQ